MASKGYNLQVKDTLWREFKAQCAYRGLSIKEVITDRIRLWTKESKRLRGKERKAGI